jgi:hypothetical protein
MAGVLIKDHYDPTAARAAVANLYAGVSETTLVYGGVALNWPVGGLNPYAVESSLKLGGKIVWLPTRDSSNSLIYGNMSGDFFDRPGISVLNDDGGLKSEVYEIMEIVQKYGACLATGHVGLEEAVLVCEEGRKRKIKIILTHPDWHRTVVPLDTQIELAKKGVWIEKQWNTVADGHITEEAFIHSLHQIGSAHIFLTTDRGLKGKERPLEGMLRFIETLLKHNISSAMIQQMLCENPRELIKGVA